jgi:small subunit ribosomal protein S5
LAQQRKDREPRDLIENVVKIFRSATVVRGGRRFSFSALVVVGDGQGRLGYGYGKANEVPAAVEKGIAEARQSMRRIALNGETIPHPVTGEFNSATVFLRPAGPGTGVIAGAPVRAVAEAAGIRNLLSKSYGSRNPKNVVKATLDALLTLRNKAEVERLRGVTLE